MHLLAAGEAPRHDALTAVDLGHDPADIVVLSAADSELACLAAAQARLGAAAPSLRLASLLQLGHPLSVDLYAARTLAGARLIVVRLLGGASYWRYGLEEAARIARRRGIALAVLPGDGRADPELDGWSNLDEAARHRLWRYLVEGGIDNAEGFLRQAAHLLGGDEPPPPRPLPVAGLHHPAGAVDLDRLAAEERPVVPILFYRALLQAADTAPVDALITALEQAGIAAVGLYATSLKDEAASRVVATLLAALRPDLMVTATGFAVGGELLSAPDCPVLQVVLGSEEAERWRDGRHGLGPRDLAMQVALPEVDGRVLARAISFKAAGEVDPATGLRSTAHRPEADRVAFTAGLIAGWIKLRRTPAARRRVAIVLANYPTRDGRLANGVGLDSPASCVVILRALAAAGYAVEAAPADGDALIATLQQGPTNVLDGRDRRLVRASMPVDRYRRWLAAIPVAARDALRARWGEPEDDPHVIADAFALSVLPLGNLVVGLQPARGYHVDPATSWHDPALVPPHGYLAFYLWLREAFAADALVHLGKHGNLEWLPGKALALSAACWPELALGPLPLLYPFIVNDPGEGSQAKRRAAAVILDHLTPPLVRAGGWGDTAELERLVDEYADAVRLDPRRAELLRRDITDATQRLGLDRDLDLDGDATDIARLDTHLCELKELQIRDGLHVLGQAPEGEPLDELVTALVRLPRGDGIGGHASLHRALAADLELDAFDPLTALPAEPWTGRRPRVLADLTEAPWRTGGDTIERLELLALALLRGRPADAGWQVTERVLAEAARLRSTVAACGGAEITALLRGLDGRFVPPGPSGAPTRGRADVLPTGRNFFSVDTRAVPTPAAWRLGWAAADAVMRRYLELHGDWPRRLALSAWGTSCMRTGGDDVAQALALMGCRPLWEPSTGRVTGVEVMPASVLGRPRVDVTLRVSGLFRDAFPEQVAMLDDAVRAVAALDEPAEVNPLAAAAAVEAAALAGSGLDVATARRRSTLRVFSSPPGAYGAGLQALIDEGAWRDDGDLAGAFVAWGGWAYGRGVDGQEAPAMLTARLAATELVVHAQDNREHDLLDSDDYYQFEGGLVAAVRHLSGRQPEALHLDHSRPERPIARRLKEEIGLVVRGRATNPRWIRGVMRHGYKGAFEIAATVDYLFAFAATARVVEAHHFEALFDACLGDPEVEGFLAGRNPAALREIADRFQEAIDRNLWRPRRNSVAPVLDRLRGLS